MELYQLRSFAAAAEHGHLTRAAERLHVSQPAVSARIRALEDGLGVPLFDRGATGMTLTPEGSKLLPMAFRVIGAAADLKSRARSLKGEVAAHVRIGTLADPETLRLGDLLARAVERHPLLHLDLRHEVTGAAFAKVREGEVDGGLAPVNGTREKKGPAVSRRPPIDVPTMRQAAFADASAAAWAAALSSASAVASISAASGPSDFCRLRAL